MLQVRPEYRGRGLAQLLVQSLADEIESRRSTVFTSIERENKTSFHVFGKSGFVSCNTDVFFGFYTVK